LLKCNWEEVFSPKTKFKKLRLAELVSASPEEQGEILISSSCLKLIFIARKMLKQVQQDVFS